MLFYLLIELRVGWIRVD